MPFQKGIIKTGGPFVLLKTGIFAGGIEIIDAKSGAVTLQIDLHPGPCVIIRRDAVAIDAEDKGRLSLPLVELT